MKTDLFLNRYLLTFPKRTGWLPMLLLAAWATFTSHLFAASPNLLWDANTGSSGAQDGSGTWNNANLNWWNAATLTDVLWNPGSNAVFGAGSGAAGTVTLGAPVTNNTIQFAAPGSGNYTIAGPFPLVLLSNANSTLNPAITVNSGLSPIISANVVSTNFNSWIYGPGTLNQASNIDSTGYQLTVGNSGTLNFSGTTLNASKLIMQGGTINFSNGTATVNGNYFGVADNGTGNFNMYGGTLNDVTGGGGLFIGNNATGNLTVNGGAVNINVGNLFIGAGYNGTGVGTGTLTLNGGSFGYTAGAIKIGNTNATGTVNLNGGTFSLNGQSLAGGTGASLFNFNGGTLRFTANNNNMLAVSNAYVRNGGALINDGGFIVTNTQSLLHTTNILDNLTDGGLTKSGSGTLVLAGTNTYNGPTIVNGGALTIAVTNGLTNSAITVNAGTLLLAGSNAIGANTITFAGGVAIGSVLAVDSDFLNWALGKVSGTFSVLAVGANSASNLTFSGAQAGMFLGGGGTGGTYTGTATWDDGNVRLGGAAGTLVYGSAITAPANLISGPVGGDAASVVALTGANSYGWTLINSGTLQVGNSTASGTLGTGPVTNNSALVVKRTDTWALTNFITGSGSLVQNGSGTLVLSNLGNNYTGGTTVRAGTLALGADNVLPVNPLVLSGGALGVANYAGTPRLLTNTVTLTVDSPITTANGDLALTGPMGPFYMLNKNGANTLTLGGLVNVTNLYVNGGTLLVTNFLNITNGSPQQGLRAVNDGVITNRGVIVLSGTPKLQFYNYGRLENAGNITNNGATVLCEGFPSTNFVNNYPGANFVQNGSTMYIGIYDKGTFNNVGGNLLITNNATVYLGGGYMPGGRTNAVGTLNINSGTVTVAAGTGAFSMGYQDTNSTGIINLNGGTFTLGKQITRGAGPGTGGLPARGFFNFNGGTLVGNVNNVTLMDNNLTQVTVSNGANISIGAGLTNTISANIQDGGVGGGLTHVGAGTLILSGTNVYAGPTVVLAGTLGINGQLNSSGPVTVGNGASLIGVGGLIAGNVTVSNNATLSPGGANSAATLNLGGKLTLLAGSKLDWSLTNNTAIGGRTNDLITVTGDVELTGPVTLNLNQLASQIAVGSYRLINYGGTLIGNPANITIVNATRLAGTIDTNTPGQINLVVSGSSTNLVWRGTPTANWNLTDSNWFNGYILDRFFNADTVLFDDTASQFSVGLAGTVLPGSVTVSASNAYALSGLGKISGTAGLTKNGSGIFTLGTTNDFTGAIAVNAGVLKLTASNAPGLAPSITVASGAQLDMNGVWQVSRYAGFIAGVGPDGLGALKNTINALHGGNQTPFTALTLTSNATFYAGANLDPVTGGGQINGGGYKLTKSGPGRSDIWGTTLNLDEFIISDGLAYSEGSNNNLGTNVTVYPTGSVGIYGNLSQNARVVLNGGTLMGCGGSTNAGLWTGPIILAADSKVDVLLVASDGSHVQINGPVSGPGALTKNGTNTLFLYGTNTYAGNTYLNLGRIHLVTNGAILNSPFISLASGTVLDVSRATNTVLQANVFVLTNNQALGGLGTVTGSVVAANGASLLPGGGAVGTFTLANSLSLSNGSAFVFDLGSVTNAGAGNDLLVVKDLVLGDGTVNVFFNFTNLAPAIDPSSNYVLIRYTGTLTTNGAATFAVQQCSFTATFTTDTTNKQILVSFAPGTPVTPNNLVWQGWTGAWGGGVGGWTNQSGAASLFFTGDTVAFDDTATNFAVNLSGTVYPGGSVVPVAAANNYTFFGAGGIAGSVGLTKTGAGTLTLSLTNAFTGPMTFGGGTSVVASVALNGNASPLGAGSSLVFDGGALRYTGPDVPTGAFNRSVTLNSGGGVIDQSGSATFFFITNLISGNGSLRKTGGRQLILGEIGTGNNNYSGNTYIDAGEVQIRSLTALGTTAGKTVVAPGAQLGYGSTLTGNLAEALDLSGDGNGNGALQAADTSTVTNVGLLTLVANASVGGLRPLTIAGQITGPGAFMKLGANTVYLTGTNNYAGATTLSNGVLQTTTAGVPGTVNNFATLTLDQTFDGTLAGPLNGTGPVNKNSVFTLTITNVNTCSSSIALNGGTLAVGADNALGTGTLNLATGTAVRSADATARTLPNSLIMSGPAMTLGSAGTGNLLFSATAHNNGALTDKIFTIANSQVTISGARTNSGGLTKRGAGTLILGGVMGLTSFTNDQGTVQLTAGGAFTNFPNLKITSGAVLDISAAAPLTLGAGKSLLAGRTAGFANDIVGSLLSTGTVTVAGASAAGTLTVSGNLTLGGGALNFDLSNTGETGGGTNDLIDVGGNLSVGGTVTLNLATLRGYYANGTYRLIRYGGTLLSGSPVNFTIAGTNGFARGSFTVSVGGGGVDLVVADTSPMLVWLGTNGSTWDMNSTVNWSNTVDGSATAFKSGDIAVFDNTAANRSVTLTGPLTPVAVIVNSGNYVLSGAGKISGQTSITKNNNGIFTLGGTSNDFTGLMQVNGGVLRAGSASVFGLSPSITVADGGQVDLYGLGITYSRIYTFTMKGFGPDGSGALICSAGGAHGAACPVGSVTLTGDTGIGTSVNGQVWDFFGGTLNANGYKLTKLGPGRFDMWGNVVNLAELIISEGLLYPEGGNERLGSNVTINANGQLGLFGTSTNTPRVVANGGAILGTGNGFPASVLAGPVVLATNTYMGDFYIFSSGPGLTTHIQMDGEVSGPGTLTKGNTNTLFLNASNSYTGDTIIVGGKVTLLARGSLASPNIFVLSNGVFDVTAQTNFTLGNGQSLQGTNTVLGQVAVSSGSFVRPGTNSVGTLTVSSNVILNGGTVVFDLGTVTNEGGAFNDLLNVGRDLVLSNLTTIQIDSLSGVLDGNAYTLINYTGALVGNPANLTVTSPGTRYGLTLDFSVTNKVRILVTSGGPAGLTWYGDFFNDPADWDVQVALTWADGYTFYQGDPVTFDFNGVTLGVNLVGTLRPGIVTVSENDRNYTFLGSGKLSGAAKLTKALAGSLILANTGVNDYTGPTDIRAGTVQIGDGATAGNLSASTTVTNNGTLAFNRSDTVTVGNTLLGTGELVQQGTGRLVLAGPATFLGTTRVTDGTLQCNGTLAPGAGTLMVAGGKLIGGTVPAPVVVEAAGAIAPGDTAIATLTVNNTVSLAGTTTMDINKNGATLTGDRIQGVSTFTCGGTLTVQASGSALAAGDSFTLFSASSFAGSFSTINLPALLAGLIWDTSTLATDGTIRVLQTYAVTGQIALEGFAGPLRDGAGQRFVTFTATSGSGTVLGAWTQELTFTDGVASYSLPVVLANAVNLSAKTAWSLRHRLPMTLSGPTTVNFTGVDQLLAGDIDGSNAVDFGDYFLLAAAWYQANSAADIDGSGMVDVDDYFLLANNWLTPGDPE